MGDTLTSMHASCSVGSWTLPHACEHRSLGGATQDLGGGRSWAGKATNTCNVNVRLGDNSSLVSTSDCRHFSFDVKGHAHAWDYHVMQLPAGLDFIVGMDFMGQHDVILLDVHFQGPTLHPTETTQISTGLSHSF